MTTYYYTISAITDIMTEHTDDSVKPFHPVQILGSEKAKGLAEVVSKIAKKVAKQHPTYPIHPSEMKLQWVGQNLEACSAIFQNINLLPGVAEWVLIKNKSPLIPYHCTVKREKVSKSSQNIDKPELEEAIYFTFATNGGLGAVAMETAKQLDRLIASNEISTYRYREMKVKWVGENLQINSITFLNLSNEIGAMDWGIVQSQPHQQSTQPSKVHADNKLGAL